MRRKLFGCNNEEKSILVGSYHEKNGLMVDAIEGKFEGTVRPEEEK